MRRMPSSWRSGFPCSLVGVLIVAYLANQLPPASSATTWKSGGLAQEQRVADYLAERYSAGGGWRAVPPASSRSLSGWQRLVVVDDSDRVVADSASPMGRASPCHLGSLHPSWSRQDRGKVYLLPQDRIGSAA